MISVRIKRRWKKVKHFEVPEIILAVAICEAAMITPCSVKARSKAGENLSRTRWSQFVTTGAFS